MASQLSVQQWTTLIHLAIEAHKFVVDTTDRVLEGILAAVAASIMHSATGMSSWGITELTLGLYKLFCQHSLEGAVDTIAGSPVSSLDEMQEMLHWLDWAIAAYEQDRRELARMLEIKEGDIVKLVKRSAIGKPAFYIAMDHRRQCVVLGIRGTFSATDVLTDLRPHSEKFEGGYAHSGMLSSARWFQENIASTLQDLIRRHRGYRIVLTGHSLGAGTASLLCMLLRGSENKKQNQQCSFDVDPHLLTSWGFCCPPCTDKELAMRCTFIRNVVHQDDIVARMTPAALDDLRSEILQTDWKQALKDGTKKKKVVELAQASYDALQGIEPASELVSKLKEQSYNAAMAWTSELATGLTKAVNGMESRRATSWLPWGTLSNAGSRVIKRASATVLEHMERLESPQMDAALTTASLAVIKSPTSHGDRKEILARNRLFIPGILYHVLRQPLGSSHEEVAHLQNLQGQKVGNPRLQQANITVMTEIENPGMRKSSTVASISSSTEFRCEIIKGNDPSSRFGRIVLSSSMMSDHLCPGLKVSIQKAICFQTSSS